jgi:hypothetical protein
MRENERPPQIGGKLLPRLAKLAWDSREQEEALAFMLAVYFLLLVSFMRCTIPK